MGALELAEKARKVAGVPGAHVEIIGSWIWLDFPAKPAVEVRDMLKAEGFNWNHKRACWQFAGRPSGGSPAARWYLAAKYGAQEVKDEAIPA